MVVFKDPFPSGTGLGPCPTGVECSCVSGVLCPPPTGTGCFVCGYDPTGCGPSGCKDYFFSQNVNYTFLNGFVQGFNGKLGMGGSESSVNIDLVFEDNRCYPSGGVSGVGGCSGCPSGSVYDGRLGYLYTFSMGSFCFRGILSNHTYSEDSGGYKYRLTLNDGRNLLSKITVILNSVYTNPASSGLPSGLQFSVLNALYFLEPSVDDCDGQEKCKDFMKSGANNKGIYLKNALIQLNNKQIQIPISKACLKLKLDRLISIMPSTYRTTTIDMSLLDLIELCCEETGHDFFVQITRDNELEILPVDYTKPVSGTPLLNLITKFSADNIAVSKEYGQEMTFEKNKRLVFGDFYHYLTMVKDGTINPTGCPQNTVSTPQTLTSDIPLATITNPPLDKLVTRPSGNQLIINASGLPPSPTGC